MTDKNLTDNEIVKALEHEIEIAKIVGDNMAYIVEMSVLTNAFDLINRQKEEIERLKPFEAKIAEFKSHIRVEDMLVFASSLEEWLEFMQKTKSEARKEFAERLENEIFGVYYSGSLYHVVDIDDVNNLLKEMESENA